MAITGVNTYQDYDYTGGVQSFTAPFAGLYKLEVWGAAGGDIYYSGAKGGYGGYSIGHVNISKNQTLYIGCGGQGTHNYGTLDGANPGGWNGGGNGRGTNGISGNGYTTGGGGATHIATLDLGTLSAYASYTSSVLIVAGGGGGSGMERNNNLYGGGGGGGLAGETGQYNSSQYWGTGGSQISAGNGGTFGAGANDNGSSVGGGGGWYGGGRGLYYCGGGGGSGYIGGVPAITFSGTTYSPNTINGQRAGHGFARITFIKNSSTVYYNGVLADKVIYNGINIDKVIFNGVTVFG